MADGNKYNIKIECGADFVLPFTWYDNNGMPVDLTGATVEAQLRETSSSPDAYDFVCTHNSAGGRIAINLPKESTTDISYSYGVYDVFVTLANGLRKRPLYGDVNVEDHVVKTIGGEMLYVIGVASILDLPAVGSSNRLYYIYGERAFYQWNGTGYVKAIDQVEAVGEWNTNTAYTNLNIVTRNGFAYIAKKDVPAGTPLSDTDYWMQITYGLTIGTVVTVDSNSQAAATITGIPVDPKLNLWIPKGAKGDKGTGIEDLGALAQLDSIDYYSSYLTGKPDLGAFAFMDELDYESDRLINKPEPYQDYLLDILARIKKFYPDLPWEIFLAIYLQEETLYIPDIYAEYVDTEEDPELVIFHNGTTVSFLYDSESEALVIRLNPQKHVEEAPIDDRYYVRQNGHWVPVELNNIGGE